MNIIRILAAAFFFHFLLISCQEGTGGESCSDGISGDNLAPVWKDLFSANKITAVFYSDKTYQLTIENTDGQSIPMGGSYSLADSGVEGNWTLTLNQNLPDEKVFEGIIQAQDNYVLKVEIVQTNPYINAIAPTPEGGLGSTKTETGGNTVPFPGNVQTFIRQ